MKNLKVFDLLKEKKENLTNEEKDMFDQYMEYGNGYIGDIISEIASNSIDIYNCDLWEFAKNNEDWIEEAIAQFGVDSRNFDLMHLFSDGEYLYYNQIFYDNLEAFTKARCYVYILDDLEIEEITNEQLEEIEALNFGDNNKQLEDIFEEINGILKVEE